MTERFMSDVLREAVEGLDRYLHDPAYDQTYAGQLRDRIVRLREEADEVRRILDTPPAEYEAAMGRHHDTRRSR